jgi:glycosyltransferase involved in cell wall biosynthesis
MSGVSSHEPGHEPGRFAPGSRPPQTTSVFIVTPGGLNERGGIGRLVTTVTRHWVTSGSGPPFRILDPWGSGFLPTSLLCLARCLVQILWSGMRGRIGLLHVHMASWGSALRKGLVVHLGAWLGIPVVLHLHAGDTALFYERLPARVRRLVRGIFVRADRILVLGEAARRHLVDVVGLDGERVVLMRNAVEPPAQPPRRDREGPCRILFLGRLEDAKGVRELLEALADPRLAALGWTATAAGPGRAEPYRQQALELGVGDRVDFPGWICEREARRRFAEADVFVLPSHSEALSMAVLEAMAFGLAVITTPVGAMQDVVAHGVSGLLVPARNAAALAGALESVIRDRALRASLQAGARRTILERFDVAGHCRRLNDLYAQIGSSADTRSAREGLQAAPIRRTDPASGGRSARSAR